MDPVTHLGPTQFLLKATRIVELERYAHTICEGVVSFAIEKVGLACFKGGNFLHALSSEALQL
jgi:hypothetical protein